MVRRRGSISNRAKNREYSPFIETRELFRSPGPFCATPHSSFEPRCPCIRVGAIAAANTRADGVDPKQTLWKTSAARANPQPLLLPTTRIGAPTAKSGSSTQYPDPRHAPVNITEVRACQSVFSSFPIVRHRHSILWQFARSQKWVSPCNAGIKQPLAEMPSA